MTHRDVMKLVILSGGIGSGKSTVARVLQTMGYRVYDCDSRAKRLMNSSPELKRDLVELLGEEAYCADGMLNRAYVGKRIFADARLLAQINALVHPAIGHDIEHWAALHSDEPLLFVETALLEESGLRRLAQGVWHVTAPETVRLRRVVLRNNMPENQVLVRIRAQREANRQDGDRVVINDDGHAVLPQVMDLIEKELYS